MASQLDKNKPRKISMSDREHFELKILSAASGLSQGTLINQLVRGFANRLQRVRREASLDPNNTVLASTCIQLLVLHDSGVLTDEEFQREIKELASLKDDTEFYGKDEMMRRVKQGVEDE